MYFEKNWNYLVFAPDSSITSLIHNNKVKHYLKYDHNQFNSWKKEKPVSHKNRVYKLVLNRPIFKCVLIRF